MTEAQRASASTLGQLYDRVYAALCGKHPDVRPWHFQYLMLRDTHVWQRRHMAAFAGRVVDVGCGERPYETWVRHGPGGVTEYVGLDVQAGPGVDVVIRPEQPWPLEPASADCILLTQVLEHVALPAVTLAEIARVLKPGGTLLLTVPFIYPAHGLPHDYQRYTTFGIRQLFEPDYDLVELTPLGRAGASIGNLILTWLENATNVNRGTRLLKGLLLPAWILFTLVVNLVCLVLDIVDRTNTHYANVGLVAQRSRQTSC